jgi:hypothetical protein
MLLRKSLVVTALTGAASEWRDHIVRIKASAPHVRTTGPNVLEGNIVRRDLT